MSKIETILSYKIKSCEEAAYLLSKYFIERNFDADVKNDNKSKQAYSSIISKQGLGKNFFGSRTVFVVTFSPLTENETSIQIESKATDGAIKEIATYILILPALRKLSDYAKMLNLCKKKSVEICKKLKIDTKINNKEG